MSTSPFLLRRPCPRWTCPGKRCARSALLSSFQVLCCPLGLRPPSGSSRQGKGQKRLWLVLSPCGLNAFWNFRYPERVFLTKTAEVQSCFCEYKKFKKFSRYLEKKTQYYIRPPRNSHRQCCSRKSPTHVHEGQKPLETNHSSSRLNRGITLKGRWWRSGSPQRTHVCRGEGPLYISLSSVSPLVKSWEQVLNFRLIPLIIASHFRIPKWRETSSNFEGRTLGIVITSILEFFRANGLLRN